MAPMCVHVHIHRHTNNGIKKEEGVSPILEKKREDREVETERWDNNQDVN